MTSTTKGKFDPIWRYLKKNGFSELTLSFSGGNDNGSIDGCELRRSDGSSVNVDFYSDLLGELKVVLEQAAEPIYDRYGSFAGDYSVSGTLQYVLKDHSVLLSGYETEYIPFDVDLSEEAEE